MLCSPISYEEESTLSALETTQDVAQGQCSVDLSQLCNNADAYTVKRKC